jgi:membrane associated rhomboid family serine protease
MGGESRPASFPDERDMFPLRDTVRSRSVPLITWGLIAANVLVFLYMVSLGEAGIAQLFDRLALVPSRLSLAQPMGWGTLVTSMFLHGGWFHLLSNMWTLFIFGDNVEDRMGSGRFLMFYLLSGVVSGLTHAYFAPGSSVPTVGASGAIAGVLGAYFLLYPGARVITLMVLVVLPWIIEIPAFVYLGLWFVSQLSSGLLNLGAAGDFGGVAWWAHVGGFVFGLIMVNLLIRRRIAHGWHRDEFYPY